MTVLVWDQLEARRYETGIERGVIYPVGGDAAAWNGLISVEETRSRESKVYYQDGVKVLERLIAPGYSAKIQAFTYPDVLDELLGSLKVTSGISVHDQFTGQFHLTYRTRIGSALDGIDHGYKLHLVYNLIVNPDDVSMESISDQPAATSFGWTVSSTQLLWGSRLVNHISIDSTEVDPAQLAALENDLYGTADSAPFMPDLETVLGPP